jgi:hypothetical protein
MAFPFNQRGSITAPLPRDAFVLTVGRISVAYDVGHEQRSLQQIFQKHVEQWKEDTEHYSSVTKMIMHPSYRRIMGMGPAALPLIFRELEQRPDHWFIALNAITGQDPAPAKSTFDDAVRAWLAWGTRQGFLE